MGHALIDNHTPYFFEALHLVDEEFRPVVTAVVKATFHIRADGRCERAEEQPPLKAEGETWGGDPDTASYKYEPEVAFFKPSTDVVLVGCARAPRSGTTELQVGVQVGAARSTAMVFGDRVWFRVAGSPAISRPAPFEEIPLVYERAFGGRDEKDPDPSRHVREPRNPVGTGLRREFAEDIRLPNIESPSELIRQWGDRPTPVGFGFVSPHWHPRAALAGTYDEAWQNDRAPLLPLDFDRRHMNAASAGLVTPRYLHGDEPVTAMGVTHRGTLSFTLPGVPPPSLLLALRDAPDVRLETNLDTVIIEPDAQRVTLFFRALHTLRSGPHDLKAIEVGARAYASAQVPAHA
jgi:hypothetical protein